MTEKQLQERQERLGSTISQAPIVSPKDRVKMEQRAVKRSKHGSIRTEYGGMMFDSKHEAKCWQELELRQKLGEITELQRQVPFELVPKQDGERSVKYIADFTFIELPNRNLIVNDAKGHKTRDYIIKRKLMLFVHAIKVIEI